MNRFDRAEGRSDEPLWHLDEELGELELQDRPGGPDRYTVRLKARTESDSYRARQEFYPLSQGGTKNGYGT